jgi:uncharacterized protein (TIGR02466 family)
MDYDNVPRSIKNTMLLFGTPVFVYDEYTNVPNIHDTTEEQVEMVLNRDQNFSSKNTCILELESYKEIKNRILNGLNEYVKDVLRIKDHEFYITQSWLNVNPPNTSHHRHNHSNAIISGVYYIDTSADACITFLSQNNNTVTNNSTLSIGVDDYNFANSTSWRVPVSNNTILYFPSTTLHEVSPNTSDKNRISLAFNCFVKGSFGTTQTLNKLEL